MPPGTHNFQQASTAALANPQLQTALSAVARQYGHSQMQMARLPDAPGLKRQAAAIRQHTLDHLDYYLAQLRDKVIMDGGQVHFAAGNDDVRRIVTAIAAAADGPRVVKANSIGGEEIDLLDYPADDFSHADMGITGGSFLVAQTGQVCVASNQGHARQNLAMPRVLVAVAGIEKVIPRLDDLAVMLKVLTRSSTGQTMPPSTWLLGAITSPNEETRQRQFHLILLDGGRVRILGSEYRPALRCIHCNACLNACPVYRAIGRDAYGHCLAGPIGAILAPLLDGLDKYVDLPQASTLCGACADVCPVGIDIPKHLLSLRREVVAQRLSPRRQNIVLKLWGWINATPGRYRLAAALARWLLRRKAKDGFVPNPPGPAAGWGEARDLPAPAKQPFRNVFK